MHNRVPSNSFFFVWKQDTFTTEAAVIAQRTRTGAILDLLYHPKPEEAYPLRDAGKLGIRLSWDQFQQPPVQQLLEKHPPAHLWIEYYPDLDKADVRTVLNALETVKSSETHLVAYDVETITEFLQTPERNVQLTLKGNEAAGYVGNETTLTLLSLVEKLAKQFNMTPDISIWGGIATAEAASALIMSGVSQIIFEHAHELTKVNNTDLPESPLHFSKLKPDQTRLLPISSHTSLRVYDRGNSPLVKELDSQLKKTLSHSTSGADNFTSLKALLKPSGKDIDLKTTLIPVGPEACHATTFAKKFGSDREDAIRKFTDEVDCQLRQSGSVRSRLHRSPVRDEIGCRYPIVQGAMACITDNQDFALSIAEAGALPTFALGMKSAAEMDSEFSELKEKFSDFNYAINVIALPENPFLQEQLGWLKENPPPFVVISAGSPLVARDLERGGISTIYVTSDIDLLLLAWKNGVRLTVLEGNEAGGHIGAHSTLTLAQGALKLRHDNNNEYSDRMVILAGGITDAETASRAAMLGADGIQLGTAYLATDEIVEHGALNKVYQQKVLDASFGETRITGSTIGLAVRSLKSPVISRIEELEHNLRLSDDEESIRQELEKVSFGSLSIAARGIHPLKHTPLPQEICLQQGQYMCGANAGSINDSRPIKALHHTLLSAQSVYPLHRKKARPEVQSRPASPLEKDQQPRIAVTGMAVSNALGNSAQENWQATLTRQSGITEVPLQRWNHSRYFSATPGPGKTYCRFGAFQSLDISRKKLGISPQDFRTMTYSTKLTLWLAEQVLQDSGILNSPVPGERIGAIIAQNSGESAQTIEDLTLTVKADEIADRILQSGKLGITDKNLLARTIAAERITIDDTTLLGRLSCTAGGFICNKYNFRGPSFSVTAACATGIVALYNAIQLIRNNILDVAIVGGGEEQLHPATFLEFSSLQALGGRNPENSRPGQTSRPFDSRRDGMVLGEGGAMLVIEREDSALARNAHIYGYISGIGASNNDRGMVESVAETQAIAIRNSFSETTYSPDDVDLIECHATATPTGDIEEVKALKTVYPQGCNTVLSSFKSQIGHTLGASGLISLIRGISAIQAGTFPPTLNYEHPDPDIDLESWGFRVCKTAEPWHHKTTGPRRFQLNAFGFGGANYVVQVEQAGWSPEIDDTPTIKLPEPPSSPEKSSLIGDIALYSTAINGRNHLIGTCSDKSEKHSLTRAVNNLTRLTADGLTADRKLWEQDIFLAAEEQETKLGLLFAGQGTQYARMGKALYDKFPTIRYWMDKVATLADFDILQLLFSGNEEDLKKTVWQQPALFLLEYAVYQQLKALGFAPIAAAGHSMGELTALAVAGVFSYKDAYKIIAKRAVCMDKAAGLTEDPGAMIAVDLPMQKIEMFTAGNPDLFITNYNSPHQTVIGGTTGAIEQLQQDLDSAKLWYYSLPVSMAFHSPLMRVIRDELGDYLADIAFHPPQIPVISNTTGKPFPDESPEIQAIILSHLEAPVLWQDNMETLHNDYDIDLFVEIGPRDTLCKFLADIAPGATSLPTCSPKDEVRTFKRAATALSCLRKIKPSHLSPSPVKITPAAIDRDENRIRRIIQEQINLFALQGVEKFLQPALLSLLRQEVDPTFSSGDLNRYFGQQSPQHVFSPELSAVPATAGHPAQSEEQSEEPPGELSTVETLISIIMDATGYERSEIEPEMSIREDLSIRSSRLPVIMDAVETTFDIVIRIEDFIDIRTIAEFADKIDSLAGSGGNASAPSTITQKPQRVQGQTSNRIDTPPAPVKRLVRKEQELPPANNFPMAIEADSSVLLLCLGADDYLDETVNWLSEYHGARVHVVRLEQDRDTGQPILPSVNEQDYSGLVILSGEQLPISMGQHTLSALFTDTFSALQKFLASPKRGFCVHLRLSEKNTGGGHLFTEGVLGMLLSAQTEYPSILFRSMLVKDLPDMQEVFEHCLDSNNRYTKLTLSEGTLHTEALHYSGDSPAQPGTPLILQGYVVLVTGGAQGVTAEIIKALAHTGATFVLLGRRPVPEAADQGAGILRSIEEMGAKSAYYQCDLTDENEIRATIAEIRREYGQIDGVFHGAGLLSDGLISTLTPDSFKKPVEVKLTGLIALVDAIGISRLRFVIGLSSIAALSGNIGQVNYCCANRAMTAYLDELNEDHGTITRSFWLPPIEGAGMADTPEVKELIAHKIGSDAFVEVNEIAAIIALEMNRISGQDSSIVIMRRFPPVNSVLVEKSLETMHGDWFDCSSRPLLDNLCCVAPQDKGLVLQYTFNHKKNPWLADHKPFQNLEHPIVSAIMVVEMMFEAASLNFPFQQTISLAQIHFDRILECPPETDVTVRVHSTTTKTDEKNGTCLIAVKREADVATTAADRRNTYYRARASSSSIQAPPPEKRAEILNSVIREPVWGEREITSFYQEYTGLQGRYRLLQTIDQVSSTTISGTMTYPTETDFPLLEKAKTNFCYYLLEGAMQLAGFSSGLDSSGSSAVRIPTAIEALHVYGHCSPGDTIHLSATASSKGQSDSQWDVLCFAADGTLLLEVSGLTLQEVG